MGKHKSTSDNKLAGGVLLGAVASGSLAVAALSAAATASAGCVSISGQTFVSGGGGLCGTTSEPGNIAVANGTDAEALADGGPGNTAIAAGTGPFSEAIGGGNFALANGNPGPNPGFTVVVPPLPNIVISPSANRQTLAIASGVLNKAFAIGDGSVALAENVDSPVTTPGNNRATTLGNGSNSVAISGNLLTPPIAAGQIANAIGNNVNSFNTP
jgi:hypothetical protein